PRYVNPGLGRRLWRCMVGSLRGCERSHRASAAFHLEYADLLMVIWSTLRCSALECQRVPCDLDPIARLHHEDALALVRARGDDADHHQPHAKVCRRRAERGSRQPLEPAPALGSRCVPELYARGELRKRSRHDPYAE